MGLDTTHGAFHGAYSAFNRFRQAVAYAAGGSFPNHNFPTPEAATQRLVDLESLDDPDRDKWFFLPDGVTRESHPGLYEFLGHSDCDGTISPFACLQVAKDLEALLPLIETYGTGGGHLERSGGYAGVTRRFIDGCRLANSQGEELEFC